MKLALLFGLLTIISCSEEAEKKINKPIYLVENKSDTERFDNPALIMGSSFGVFFQMQHKTGRYDEMLSFTSKETKAKFTETNLVDFFQNMKFSYPLKLKTIKDNDNFQILFYESTIDATQKTIQINVVIENDTCKIIFDSLDEEKPFLGI